MSFDETGDRLSPTHAIKAGVRYRYYVSYRLTDARRQDDGGWRLPAKELERPILNAIVQHLSDELDLASLLSVNGLSPQAWRTIHANGRQLATALQAASAMDKVAKLRAFIQRVELHKNRITIQINAARLLHLLTDYAPNGPGTSADLQIATIDLQHRLKRRGVEAKLVVGNGQDRLPRARHRRGDCFGHPACRLDH